MRPADKKVRTAASESCHGNRALTQRVQRRGRSEVAAVDAVADADAAAAAACPICKKEILPPHALKYSSESAFGMSFAEAWLASLDTLAVSLLFAKSSLM